MDVTLPDGTVIKDVPDGMSKADLTAKLAKNGYDISKLTQPSQAPQSGIGAQMDRLKNAADQAHKENGRAIDGLGEAALNMGSGIASSAAGGLRGLWNVASALVQGKDFDSAMNAGADSVRATQEAGTYQPRTGAGKLITELASTPFTLANAAAEKAGEGYGMAYDVARNGGVDDLDLPNGAGAQVGRAFGKAMPDVAMALLGGKAALSKFNGRSPVADRASAVAQDIAPGPLVDVAPTPDYDIPAYQRAGIATPETQPIQPQGFDLGQHVTNRDFMSSLSDFDRDDLLNHYAMSKNPLATSALRDSSASTGAEIVGRNLATSIPQNLPITESPRSNIAAQVANTDDIKATLQAFGVDTPAAAPSAQVPARAPIPGPPLRAIEPEPAPAAVQTVAADAPSIPDAPPSREANMQVLRDIGLDKMRESALTGDAATGAREFQLGKFTSEPAGLAANDHFQSEFDAMTAHGQKLVDATGAQTGMDENAMGLKGVAMAAPYNGLRLYFETAKKRLYELADERAGQIGKPVVTAETDALLDHPDFQATLMAKDQQGLMNTIQSQLDRFKALGPDGKLTIENAENFRKWMNADDIWTPSNSKTLAKVKGALDADVFKAAGEDVYSAGRKLHQLEKKTLDDPNGISKLMDADPYAPINRATPYEKIPNSIMNLSTEQFKHIIDTYRDLPDELQPMGQQAINTIKAHFAEEMLERGSKTTAGNTRQIWNDGGVAKLIKNNSAKVEMLYDSPAEAKHIADMIEAGRILRVNPAYPGAAAQAANAIKHGLMSQVVGKAATTLGGGAGALMAGPVGGAAGAAIGDTLAGKLTKGMGERKALEQFNKGIYNDALQKQKETTIERARESADEWERSMRPQLPP